MCYSSFPPFFSLNICCLIAILNNTDLLVSSLLQVFHVATILAQNYFDGKLAVTLSAVEASILSCIGLQLKDISSLEVSKLPTLIAVVFCYWFEDLMCFLEDNTNDLIGFCVVCFYCSNRLV